MQRVTGSAERVDHSGVQGVACRGKTQHRIENYKNHLKTVNSNLDISHAL